MEFAKIKSKYYCGADLHSKTTYIKIMNGEGDILYNRNLPNNFAVFKSSVQSCLPDLVVGAESTLVITGCMTVAERPAYHFI